MMTDLTQDRPPTRGWRANPIVRFFTVVLGGLWTFTGRPLWWAISLFYRAWAFLLILAAANTVTYARTRWKWLVHGYDADDESFGAWIDRRVVGYMDDPWIRIPFSFSALVIGTPLMFVMVLAIGLSLPVGTALTIDQVTYPRHELAEQFRLDGPNANRVLTPEERGILVTDALVYQLEYELNSVAYMTWQDWRTLNFNGFWGWTPNDLAGYGPLAWPGLFDNRQNRQLGIIYAVRVMTDSWSIETSKLGSADRENADLVRARTEGFSFSSHSWAFPSSEGYYRDGIEAIRIYQEGLRSGDPEVIVNVTSRNLANVLRAMAEMLQEPQGRLIDRNATVLWSEIDDTIFYGQGAAIVARDMLAAISIAYADEFERGQLDRQVLAAIESLSAAAHFNPLFNMRGDGDSMIGDHRAKIARYINEALRRIEDIYQALES
jgi:hypothetical protein